jgi:hypothetical protein
MLEVWNYKNDTNLKVDYGLVTVDEWNSDDFVFWLPKTLRESLPGARQTGSMILTCSKYKNCVSLLEWSQKVHAATAVFYQKWEAL